MSDEPQIEINQKRGVLDVDTWCNTIQFSKPYSKGELCLICGKVSVLVPGVCRKDEKPKILVWEERTRLKSGILRVPLYLHLSCLGCCKPRSSFRHPIGPSMQEGYGWLHCVKIGSEIWASRIWLEVLS